MLDYDHDKIVELYGFGAKPNFPEFRDGSVSNFFPCSGNKSKTSGKGIKGCFELYQNAINCVEFARPTRFAPMIKAINDRAESKAEMSSTTYTIHLILAGGVIEDMSQTIREVVRASKNPISIIIIGLGLNEDFRKMELLDSDGKV